MVISILFTIFIFRNEKTLEFCIIAPGRICSPESPGNEPIALRFQRPATAKTDCKSIYDNKIGQADADAQAGIWPNSPG